MDVTIYPEPNPAVTAALLSPATRAFAEERANTALMLYQAIVAKRTARLARSGYAHAEIGGKNHDRWIGELVIGRGIDYGASHEFGVQAEDEGPEADDGGGPSVTADHGAHDLNEVLQMLAAY